MPAMVLSIIKHCLHIWFPPVKTKATFISFGLHFPNQNKAQASLFLLPNGEVYQKMHFLTYHYYF